MSAPLIDDIAVSAAAVAGERAAAVAYLAARARDARAMARGGKMQPDAAGLIAAQLEATAEALAQGLHIYDEEEPA